MNHLLTAFEKNAGFTEYPRPQLVRSSFLNLNGKWRFEINDNYIGEIIVPYPPESRISGIFRSIGKKDVMRYSREFILPVGFVKDRVILHFGAVDTVCQVYVNGALVGKNEGGYLPFSFDITDYIKEKNTLEVTVFDRLDKNYPYGKQRKKRGGMWYTPISGIWQSVWIESVCHDYIKSIKMTTNLDNVMITVDGGIKKKQILFEGECFEFYGESYLLRVKNPVNWTPDNPKLYSFTLISGEDRVESYFALRTFAVIGNKLMLNGKPYFFHGLLDQGYFPDGIFTPASEKGYLHDILTAKKCGFNMLRKHIKLEPDIFYYYCDKYGMAVFQDFVNSGGYNFIIDTALPNLFLKRGVTHFANKKRRKLFLKTGDGIVDTLYNHPSVLYYTVFNEGWGQFDADNCYAHFKRYDRTRVYDTTSGWFKTKLSDVESEHVYFKAVKLSKKKRPTVLSEFGGYSCVIAGHCFNKRKNYGYGRSTKDPKVFEKRLVTLYERDVVKNISNGLYATVLTQLSDVEDETNGIMTYDREVLKVNPDTMQTLANRIFAEFDEVNANNR